MNKKTLKMYICKVLKNYVLISKIPKLVMSEVLKCECPPGSESYENPDGVMICISCDGWIPFQE